MQCPLCKSDCRITNTRTQVVGDNSPDTQTRVYAVQEMSCINQNCQNHMLVVGEEKALEYEGPPVTA